MARIELSFLETHNPIFMNGSNLGNKILLKQKGAIAHLDTELLAVILQFKNKATLIPTANVASMDVVRLEDLNLSTPEVTNVPPAIARSRREAPQVQESVEVFDPNDDEAAHRARVRAASANTFKAAPPVQVQDDALLQQSKSAAMGVKSAQVSTPTQPAQGANVVGKTKALTHAQLKAQLAKEDAQGPHS